MFSNFTAHYLLPLAGAMMFDFKIIVLAATPELLSQTAFGILGLVWPLTWPGTFIPILPKRLETVLEMPFGSIIGVHSTLTRNLISENFGAYFEINADTHDGSSVGTEDFPPEMIREADAVAEEIKELLRSYKPIFPVMEVQRKVKEFICRTLGAIYNVDWKSPRPLYEEFLKMRQSTAEDVPAMISQSQFVDTIFREAMEEQDLEIQGAMWPDYDCSESYGRDTLRITPLTVTTRFGVKTGSTSGKHRVNLNSFESEIPISDQESSAGEPPVSDSEWEQKSGGRIFE
jgi:hypothetical protein